MQFAEALFPSSRFLLCLSAVVLSIRPLAGQEAQQQPQEVIANIADLDSAVPNFYRWMEQNAHVCEIGSGDAPQFLSEVDADQFDCRTLCGDPIDNPHLACAKRADQQPQEFPHCETIPDLCVLNFVQEFLALKVARGDLSVEHLFEGTTRRTTSTAQTTTTKMETTEMPVTAETDEEGATLSSSSPISSEQNTAGTRVNSFELRFRIDDDDTRLVDSDFAVVDGEVVQQRQQSTKATGHTGGSRKEERQANVPLERILSSTIAGAGSSAETAATTLLPPKRVPGALNGCADTDPEACHFWAGIGECARNQRYMLLECRRSCGVCPPAEEFRKA